MKGIILTFALVSFALVVAVPSVIGDVEGQKSAHKKIMAKNKDNEKKKKETENKEKDKQHEQKKKGNEGPLWKTHYRDNHRDPCGKFSKDFSNTLSHEVPGVDHFDLGGAYLNEVDAAAELLFDGLCKTGSSCRDQRDDKIEMICTHYYRPPSSGSEQDENQEKLTHNKGE